MAYRHFEFIEKHAWALGLGTAFMVSLGGLAEITPLFMEANKVQPAEGVKPYPPLHLAGRDVYVREGCASRPSATATTRRRPNRSTTDRSSGAPSAPARIWRASAASTLMNGSAFT